MLGRAQLPICHILHDDAQVDDERVTLWDDPRPLVVFV